MGRLLLRDGRTQSCGSWKCCADALLRMRRNKRRSFPPHGKERNHGRRSLSLHPMLFRRQLLHGYGSHWARSSGQRAQRRDLSGIYCETSSRYLGIFSMVRSHCRCDSGGAASEEVVAKKEGGPYSRRFRISARACEKTSSSTLNTQRPWPHVEERRSVTAFEAHAQTRALRRVSNRDGRPRTGRLLLRDGRTQKLRFLEMLCQRPPQNEAEEARNPRQFLAARPRRSV
jgi:hypothetical protein